MLLPALHMLRVQFLPTTVLRVGQADSPSSDFNTISCAHLAYPETYLFGRFYQRGSLTEHQVCFVFINHYHYWCIFLNLLILWLIISPWPGYCFFKYTLKNNHKFLCMSAFQVMKYCSGMGSCYQGQPWRKFTTSFWSLKLSLKWSWWCPGLLGKSEIKHTTASVTIWQWWEMQPFRYKSISWQRLWLRVGWPQIRQSQGHLFVFWLLWSCFIQNFKNNQPLPNAGVCQVLVQDFYFIPFKKKKKKHFCLFLGWQKLNCYWTSYVGYTLLKRLHQFFLGYSLKPTGHEHLCEEVCLLMPNFSLL